MIQKVCALSKKSDRFCLDVFPHVVPYVPREEVLIQSSAYRHTVEELKNEATWDKTVKPCALSLFLSLVIIQGSIATSKTAMCEHRHS